MSKSENISSTAENCVDLITDQLAGTDFNEEYLLEHIKQAIESSEKKPTCYYCGKPAIKLCDGVSHFIVGSKMKIISDWSNAVEYCDRPLCEDHAEKVGMSTASGHVDSIDYCPKHVTKMKLGEGVELKQR